MTLEPIVSRDSCACRAYWPPTTNSQKLTLEFSQGAPGTHESLVSNSSLIQKMEVSCLRGSENEDSGDSGHQFCTLQQPWFAVPVSGDSPSSFQVTCIPDSSACILFSLSHLPHTSML